MLAKITALFMFLPSLLLADTIQPAVNRGFHPGVVEVVQDNCTNGNTCPLIGRYTFLASAVCINRYNGDSYYLTLQHVLKGSTAVIRTKGQVYQFSVVQHWNNPSVPDAVVLLKVKGPTPDTPLPMTEAVPAPGDKLWMIGYPHGRFGVAACQVRNVSGSIISTGPLYPSEGMSGGPVVNADGQVVGLTFAYEHNNAPVPFTRKTGGMTISTTAIVPLLKDIFIPPARPPTEEPEESQKPETPKQDTKPQEPPVANEEPEIPDSQVPDSPEIPPSSSQEPAGEPWTSKIPWGTLITIGLAGAGIGATGGAGAVAWKAGSVLLKRYIEKRKENRGSGNPGGFSLPNWKQEVPTQEPPSPPPPPSQEARPDLPLPREIDEARELLHLRKCEGHHPIHDALFGVLAQDEIRNLAETCPFAVDLYRKIRERFDEIAPISTGEKP